MLEEFNCLMCVAQRVVGICMNRTCKYLAEELNMYICNDFPSTAHMNIQCDVVNHVSEYMPQRMK